VPDPAISDVDRGWLRSALDLAASIDHPAVSPNPRVGAVIVGAGRQLGAGAHERLGGPHAEAAALADCRARGEDPRGATLYLTLEPCAHQGRQPPCAPAIRDAGIARVVIASDDPSAHARGRGPSLLAAAGIEITWAAGQEGAEARRLNQPFRKRARTGRPHVTLKSALSLDGRTATRTGDSQWISGPESRFIGHVVRHQVDAIAVGIGTALVDDPLLTARAFAAERQPTRVVFDSEARLPLGSRLVETAREVPLVVVASEAAAADRVAALERAGAAVLACRGEAVDRVRMGLERLGTRGIAALLLEGGATLAGSFNDAGEIDALSLYVAPLVVGGSDARPLIGGLGAGSLDEARRALRAEWQTELGGDLSVNAVLREW
jgi:diaminohydroxyphosphoribosylaminopyrimidine deaminase / 5-amino-6-(5-phosphoribosylamino)uracil reductase